MAHPPTTREEAETVGLPVPLARVLDAVQRGAQPGIHQARAVRWLSVPQLVRTALDVLQASSFAKYADKRETMATNPREYYRMPGPRDAVFVDYVADTGDGFNATFATARCLSGAAAPQPDPEFAGRGAQADLLVFGGDEVYPVASALQYEERLNVVLRTAAGFDEVDDLPPVMALPGNHDWYDGLASFRRNFCESWVQRDMLPGEELIDVPAPDRRDDIGGWGAFQSRSYFAVQLSPQWWLWAVDSQLDAPIDAEQLSYFRGARQHLRDAKIILCTATPSWLEAERAGRDTYLAETDTPLYTLLWFVDRVLGAAERHRLRLVLTGDQHHYARYTCTAPTPPPDTVPSVTEPFGPELVTCGGGGAFLASTHHLPERLSIALRPWPSGSGATVGYEQATCYPDAATSRAIGRAGFLAAAWRNGPSLPLLIGAVDVALFLTFLLHWPFGWPRAWQFWVTTGIVAVLLGLYAASGVDALRPRFRRQWATGLLLTGHTLAHLAAAGAVAALVAVLVADPSRPPWFAYLIAIAALVALGTMVFVTYLHVADRFGCHTLEAFSGMRIEDWKSHLRLRVSADEVVVQVIGIDATPSARHRSDLSDVMPRPRVVETFRVPIACPPVTHRHREAGAVTRSVEEAAATMTAGPPPP
jgi:Calcineurin-like phosphoesterase